MISHPEEINTYSFFLQYWEFAGHRRMGRDQDCRRWGSADLPSCPSSQSSGRTLWPFQRAPYTCSWVWVVSLLHKTRNKESVTNTANIKGKLETRRNTDAPKVGVPHRRSNLGISPQSLLEGVSKSSLDTKKNLDFQYLKEDSKSLTILVFLP